VPTVAPSIPTTLDVITTANEGALPLLRLMHLVSPSLPIGAFTYSQGIEWAVESGWIRTANHLEGWLSDQLHRAVAYVDLPLLARMHAAAGANDPAAMDGWIDWLLACRETVELRLEEANRGRALAELLVAWGSLGSSGIAPPPSPGGDFLVRPLPSEEDWGEGRPLDACTWKPVLARSQAAGFAFCAVVWNVPSREALLGYAWGWLENLVLAAVKIIPLGQTQGQQVLRRLTAEIPQLVAGALALNDGEIGASSPALAIASSAHETQYTRLFRS
jgi:urease accessory protein